MFQVFDELGKIEKSNQSNIQKSQFSIFLWIRKKFEVQAMTNYKKSQF